MRDVFDTSQFQMAESRTSLRSSENKRCTFVRGLPPELWRTIFGFLPVTDLCRANLVCKTWRELGDSLDGTTWKEHFLRSNEWRHPDWPRDEEEDIRSGGRSWRQLYKDHRRRSRLWATPNREPDQANCLGKLKRKKEHRTLRVGRNYEFETLKCALSCANEYDRIILAPGVYEEQVEISSKCPFEIVGEGDLGQVVLLTCIDQTALSGRLCNLVLRAPWFTAQVIKVTCGHLQVDNCRIEDGQIIAVHPGTLHMRYCHIARSHTVISNQNVSLIENTLFKNCESGAVYIEGLPKSDHGWIYPHLIQVADTYGYQQLELTSKSSNDLTVEDVCSVGKCSLEGSESKRSSEADSFWTTEDHIDNGSGKPDIVDNTAAESDSETDGGANAQEKKSCKSEGSKNEKVTAAAAKPNIAGPSVGDGSENGLEERVEIKHSANGDTTTTISVPRDEHMESTSTSSCSDTTSDSDSYSDSCTSNTITPILFYAGRPVPMWLSEDTDLPNAWGGGDPFPAAGTLLRHDPTLRQLLHDIQGVVIRRCKIVGEQGGITVSRQGHAHIEQTEFRDVQFGIRSMQQAKVAVVENSFHHITSSAIFMRLTASGLIVGNDIYCTGEAGIDVRKQADPLIQYNRIHHSKRSGVVVLGSGRGTIKMNDIYQNREAGIYVLYKGDPYISGNRICHGSAAGIAVTESGKGHIVDNLISGNRWGGIDIRHCGDPRVTCNLICNGMSDGIVVGSKGLGTIEANVIRGNIGCGLWVMSGKPVIQSNQVYNNKDSGMVFMQKKTGDAVSVAGSDDSDSDVTADVETSNISTDNTTITELVPSLRTDVKYNSVYHNAGFGFVANCEQVMHVHGNAFHANRDAGVCIKQTSSVSIQDNSITCNAGAGVQIMPGAKVTVEGCGVYDNIGHGIQTEGETCVTDCDILCNQRHAISAEGAANIKVERNRLFSLYEYAINVQSGASGNIKENKCYKGRCDNPVRVSVRANCLAKDNELQSARGQDCRGYEWQLDDPPLRPHIDSPPRVSIPSTPARRVMSVTRVVVPSMGGCQGTYTGSTTCIII